MLRVGSVEVGGGLESMAAETERLTAPFKDRPSSVADLYDLAGRIEAAYARRGYILARVTVPPQNLSDGATVRLMVTDGVIAAVSLNGVPARMRATVALRTAGLVGRQWPTLDQIERALVLSGALPGLTLHSALAPGAEAGTTTLIVAGDYAPVTFGLNADNRLGGEFADWELAPTVSLNGLLGMGETVYVSAIAHPDSRVFHHDNVRRVLGVGAVVPVGSDGLAVNPEFTLAETNPRLGPGAARTRGEFRRLAVRLSYPFIKDRHEDLELSGSVEAIDETQDAIDFGTRLSDDRLRNLTLGLDWARAWPGGMTLSASLLGTQGVSGLGARTAADVAASGVPFSRQGVSPVFTKLEGSARLSRTWPSGVVLAGTVRFQASASGALASSEQFNLDSPDGMSTFPIGRLTGDSGFTARAEIAREFRVPGSAASISPYLFGAVGDAFLDQPTALERATVEAKAYGAGVRVSLRPAKARTTLYGAVEVGRAQSNSALPDSTRVSIDLGVRF